MYPNNQLIWQLLSALAFTATIANAQKPLTKSYCTTSFDTKSTNLVKSKTDYSTRTEKPTIYVTSTPSTTITPPPSTATSVVATMTTITVTASQVTDTFTDITTILQTSTVEAPTVTYTSTVYETTETTATSTSTVPTPAGFIPIQTSVGKNPPAINKREAGLSSPNSGSLIARANAIRDSKNSGSSGSKPSSQYPKKVECKVQVTVYASPKTSVKTAKTTTTITAPAQTNTVTTTTTYEATSTYLPTPASTTVHTETTVVVEETTTPSTTVATTQTATNTVYAPTETYYAQCQPDNYIGTNGWIGSGSASESRISGIASAYDCCAACALQAGCEYAAFQPEATGFGCILLANAQQTCTDKEQFALLQDVNRYSASNGCVNAKYGSG